ncbi:MAG: (Fe-S)-binding protein, partial [Candidatus Bathyarchaeia archaeon]
FSMSGSVEGFRVEISRGRCLKDPTKVMIEAFHPGGFGDSVEMLALMLPPLKARYSRQYRCTTVISEGRLIGVYSDGRILFCAKDVDEARSILEYVRSLLEEASRLVGEKGPPSLEDIEAYGRLSAFKLYEYLPKTNCGLCGYSTCVAFATKVLRGEAKLKDCSPLNTYESMHLVVKLEKDFNPVILKSLGWLT